MPKEVDLDGRGTSGEHPALECQESFLAAAENALRSRPKDEEALKDEQIKQLKQKIGDLVLDLDILKEAMKGHPFAPKTSDE